MTQITTPVATSPAKRTDLGNAQRLVARYADVIRYVHATNRWHIWNGAAWAPDETGQIERFARETVKAMQRQADALPYTEEDDSVKVKAVKWAIASESAAKLAAMVQLARSEADIAVLATDFDTRTYELNCPNGVVDLQTGALMNHDPAAMHSQCAAVAYKKTATAPQWQAFLQLVLPDRSVRTYVHRLLGASLLGQPLPRDSFPFVYGPGGTGKSTLLESVLHVLGDYGRLAPANLLVAKRGGNDQTYDIAALRGARFVLASEGHSRQRLAEDVVKRITADRTLAGRQIREAEITFPNVTALWFTSNHEPRVDGTDTGLFRRMRKITMDVSMKDNMPPEWAGAVELKDRLVAEEGEGILAWLVAGCVSARKHGVEPPKRVIVDTETYQAESNPLREWLDACCQLDELATETGPALHESYIDWCAATRRPVDYRNGKSSTWANALKGLGLRPYRSATGRGYRGAKLIQPGL
jgi:putative DNA primase/helicase